MARESVKRVVIEGKAKTSAIRKGLKDIQKGANAAGQSAAQASGQFASMSARLRSMDKGIKDARAQFDKFNRILGMAGIAGSVVGAVKAIDGLITSSAKTQGIMKNLQVSIAGARSATRGWVSDLELARNANRATDLGIAKTSKEFEVLASAAFAASRRLGIDASEAMDTLTSAIANQSKARLDNLGIVIDVNAAQADLARTLGVSTDQLTDTQKATAFQTAAMEALTAAAESTDTTVDGLTDAWMRFRTELENLSDMGIPEMINSLGAMEAAAEKAKNAVLDARIANGETVGRDISARKAFLENEKAEAEVQRILEQVGSQGLIADQGAAVDEMLKKNAFRKPKRGRAERETVTQSRGGKPKADSFDFQNRHLAEQEALREHELAKAEIMLSERMRALEVQQAEGVDPVTLITAEEEARMALLEKQLEFADTEIEQMQIRDEMRQTHHEAELKRLDEQTKAEKAKLAHTQAVLGATANTFSHVGGIIQSTADMGIVSQRKAAGAMAVAKATENAVIGILETSKAAAAAASYNIPQAVLHGAAAATAFVGVGLSMAEATKMGASGGGSAAVKPDMRFGGGNGGVAPPTGGGGSGSGDRPTVPGSGPPPVPAGGHGGGKGGGTVNVNIQGFVASTKEELGLEVRKALNASEQEFGEVAI